VRLQPAVVQNVVVYSTVIAVPNPQLKLKPGMTATVGIEIARRNNALRVPSAAVRFRPTEPMFQVLNQPVPPELQRGAGGLAGGRGRDGGGRGRDGGAGAPQGGAPQGAAPQAAPQPATQAAAPTPAPQARAPQAAAQPPAGGRPVSPEARGGGDGTAAAPGGAEGGRGFGGGGGRGGFDPNMTPEERRKRMEERMASMTPEERERMQARMKEREAQGGGRGDFGGGPGGQPWSGGGRGQGGGRNATPGTATPGTAAAGRTGRDLGRGITGNVTAGTSITSGHTTIDSLFGPLPTTETRGRAWLYENKQLKSVALRLGVSDGTYSEVVEGDLKEGQEVVVNMVTGLEPVTRPGQQQGTGNPLMGPQRGGPGGGGGGNRGGGGGRGF
jgi:hypothetical protein